MSSDAVAALSSDDLCSTSSAAQAVGDASQGACAAGAFAATEHEAVDGDGLTCAICLGCIDPADLALIPNCEHQYCENCILHWAIHKEATWCPQCRVPFSQLLTYRKLDGSLRDFPASESVCLLKRTTRFQEYMTAREKGKSPAPAAGDGSIPPEVMDWHDYGRFYDEYDDDEEVENYYFSAAAGRARIILGNRRWGENGFVSSGRMQARPVAPARPAKGGSAGKASPVGSGGKGDKGIAPAASPAAAPATPAQPAERAGSAAVGVASAQAPAKARSPHTPARPCALPGSDNHAKGSSGSRSGGRRARRNARRAAVDARSGGLDFD